MADCFNGVAFVLLSRDKIWSAPQKSRKKYLEKFLGLTREEKLELENLVPIGQDIFKELVEKTVSENGIEQLHNCGYNRFHRGPSSFYKTDYTDLGFNYRILFPLNH